MDTSEIEDRKQFIKRMWGARGQLKQCHCFKNGTGEVKQCQCHKNVTGEKTTNEGDKIK